MGDNPNNTSNDELVKDYEKMTFPSGDLDDLIFCQVEIKESER